jgi:DNA-binding transcriptional MerR regulator
MTLDLAPHFKVNPPTADQEATVLIGELATATGVPTSTLRYYERQGLLHPPQRTSAGYRTYPSPAADRVAFIKRAQAAGLTLGQVRQVLAIRDDGQAPCRHVADLVDDQLAAIDQRMQQLRRARAGLHDIRRRLEHLEPAECEPGAVCSAVE